MVYIETQRVGFKHYAIAQARIIELPAEINFSQLARAIYSVQHSLSFVTQLGKTQKFYILTSGRSSSKNKAIEIAIVKMKLSQTLLLGAKFDDCGINDIELKIYNIIYHVLQIPPAKSLEKRNPFSELTTKLGAIGCPINIFLNIQSLPPSKEIVKNLSNFDSEDSAFVSEPCFAVSYSMLMSDNDKKILRNNVEQSLSILGGIFNTERYNLQIKIDTKRYKIIKALRTLLLGKLYWKTLLRQPSDLAPLLHIPKIYGVDTSVKPEFYVPTFSEFQANSHIPVGNVLGNFDEKLYPAYLDPNTIFQNIVVWGEIGFGKSTFVMHLIVRVHNQTKIRMLIFDLHNEYRKIVSLLDGELGKDVLIFNPYIYPFSINPLEIPENLTDRDRDIIIVETIDNFISLLRGLGWTIGEVQLNRCRIHLNELYEKTSCPTISQLIELLKTDMRSKIKQDEDSLPFKCSQFTEGFYGNLFNQPHTTLPFKTIENATTIFELGKLPIELRTFFSTVFLTQFWNYRRVSHE